MCILIQQKERSKRDIISTNLLGNKNNSKYGSNIWEMNKNISKDPCISIENKMCKLC